MNCYNHPHLEIAANCQSCGEGLCPMCASIYKPCLCRKCAVNRVMRILLFKVFLPVSLAGVAYYLGKNIASMSESYYDLLILVLVGLPYGLRQVRTWWYYKGQDSGSANAGLFVFQLIIAGLIGIPILIYRLICAIWHLTKSICAIIKILMNPVSKVISPHP